MCDPADCVSRPSLGTRPRLHVRGWGEKSGLGTTPIKPSLEGGFLFAQLQPRQSKPTPSERRPIGDKNANSNTAGHAIAYAGARGYEVSDRNYSLLRC